MSPLRVIEPKRHELVDQFRLVAVDRRFHGEHSSVRKGLNQARNQEAFFSRDFTSLEDFSKVQDRFRAAHDLCFWVTCPDVDRGKFFCASVIDEAVVLDVEVRHGRSLTSFCWHLGLSINLRGPSQLHPITIDGGAIGARRYSESTYRRSC